MIKCSNCGTESLDSCQFCDECGTRLARFISTSSVPEYQPPVVSEAAVNAIRSPNVTTLSNDEPADSLTVDPINSAREDFPVTAVAVQDDRGVRGKLVIERGDSPGVEFNLNGSECVIGRWDADNGVFPDVDLDAYDSEAKVSRRHARIRFQSGEHVIEDLGSTNGTYVNRGRRLLPGMAQVLKDGDELIVGKTFLRFHTVRN